MSAPTGEHPRDPRQARTRSWILHAFTRLVLRRPYEDVGVVEISRRAGVGRSTFYEHFDDKDDLLRQSLAPVLTPLADAAGPAPDPQRIEGVLRHFHENRDRVLSMLDGPSRALVEAALAELIIQRLADTAPPPATRELHAAAIAGAQVALALAWLRNPRAATVSAVASIILDESRRMSGR